MSLTTYEDYRKSVLGQGNPIDWDSFDVNTSLNKTWETIKTKDDARYAMFDGESHKFKKRMYDYFVVNIDNVLRAYFKRRLECTEMPNFRFAPEQIKNNTIRNRPDGVRYIRSVFNDDMQNTEKTDGLSFQNIFQNIYYRGDFSGSAFSVPSVLKDIDFDNPEEVPESLIVTLRTVAGQMSVFSPATYRTLLLNQQPNIKTGKSRFKLLCPTASWGSPVIAAKHSNYDHLHIVDVQCAVLDKCHAVKKDIFREVTLFPDEYDLKTFCIPSEKMADVVEREYDHIFFCPPYYDLEVYKGNDEQQSTTLYKTYEEWLDGYWRGTVNAAYEVMAKGGVFSFVMNNHANGRDLGPDMLEIAKEKFEYLDEVIIKNTDKNLDFKVDRYEIAYEMRKK